MAATAYIILAGSLLVPVYAWLAFARTPKGRQ
jgi:hypothetical protein